MIKGLFFAFEGIDGCGKSSQAALLVRRLSEQDYHVVATREPGGTAIAEKIRQVLLDPNNHEMTSECELLLYLAARAQHIREKIIPAIASGSMVLCDRFQYATFAYQGYGREIPIEPLRRLNGFATGGIDPDLTFVFDLPVAIAAERMSAMNKQKDRLESGGYEFFERVRNGYRDLAGQNPEAVVLLDGTRSVEELADQVYSLAIQKIKQHAF
jgi:dTMP kinase